MITIQFLGATDTVTGSRYLLKTDRSSILVDCGLFQGYKKLRERNWVSPPFEPASLDAVVLTHAHIDHSGYLPRLRKLGFKGPVYCTPGTRDLLQILLPDAGFLQEEDADQANRLGYTRHHPAEPLYTRSDGERCLSLVKTKPFFQPFNPVPEATVTFVPAGHIIGSACVSVRCGERTITFSGDVGRPNDPIMKPPALLPPTDYLVVESTYGNRPHPKEDAADTVANIVNQTVFRHGVIIVPSFAVGRAQHLLHILSELRVSGRIPEIPTYLDSPMAVNATEIFCHHQDEHKISKLQSQRMCQSVTYSHTAANSQDLDRKAGPMIIISSSGMATGGRILHHLHHFLPDPKNTILFVGYQAPGTRGESLIHGASEVKIHGDYVPVRAQIVQIESLSAHADYTEIIDWLQQSQVAPRQVFVTHGEPASSDAFRRRLRDTFGWNVGVPGDGQTFELI